MSHPVNKRERFLIGVKKSKKRVALFMSYKEKVNDPERVKHWERHHRNTSKTCSCPMCGNPRKYSGELTMQEQRMLDKECECEW